jgi:uncharacterized protein (TIGR03435 family)
MGDDGFAGRAPLIQSHNGNTKRNLRKETMERFASMLSGFLDRPVTDATELKGSYDWTFTFSGPASAGSDTAGTPEIGPPGILEAVQSELGLKLESKRAPVDMLVIDHIERKVTQN